MPSLLTINWNPDPELFNLFGSFPIRYYGLLWGIGIVLSCIIVQRQYRDRKISEDKFTPLFFYCVIGITPRSKVRALHLLRLSYYQNHLIEMILPIRQFPGEGWKWIGYKGLASHGGTLGLIIALWLYCRKTKMHYMDVLDMIAVATPHLRLLYPPCQPDELRNHWQANRYALGFCIRTSRYATPAIRHSFTKQSPTLSSSWE